MEPQPARNKKHAQCIVVFRTCVKVKLSELQACVQLYAICSGKGEGYSQYIVKRGIVK